MALLEEARARLHFDDAALLKTLGVKDRDMLAHWRRRRGVPEEHRGTLLKIITDRLRPEEMEERSVAATLGDLVTAVREAQVKERFDQIVVLVESMREAYDQWRGGRMRPRDQAGGAPPG